MSVAPDIKVTDREREIIHWMAEGKTASEIGTILSVSEHTVARHVWSARLKFDAVNSMQLIAKAFRHQVIT
jgi:LuxR family quorum sensing-dependent transcriptional regulator